MNLSPPTPSDDGSATVPAPVAWVRSVGNLRLPARTDRRLTDLMDRHTDGALTASERAELESLVEVSETLSLVRANALGLLGGRPG